MLLGGYNKIEQQQLDDIDAKYKANGFQPILIPTSEIPDTDEYYKTFDEYLRETRDVLQQASSPLWCPNLSYGSQKNKSPV